MLGKNSFMKDFVNIIFCVNDFSGQNFWYKRFCLKKKFVCKNLLENIFVLKFFVWNYYDKLSSFIPFFTFIMFWHGLIRMDVWNLSIHV